MDRDQFIKLYQDHNCLPSNQETYAEFLEECLAQGYSVQSFEYHADLLVCPNASGVVVFKAVDAELFPYTVFEGFDVDNTKAALEFTFGVEQCNFMAHAKGNGTVVFKSVDDVLAYYYGCGVTK